jgi:hypothetical protein
MRHKEYKKGDRIFYECYDGTIGTSIVLDTEDRVYESIDDKPIKFKMLKTGPYTSIEDYSCLPMSDPRVKELIKKYKKFDKEKGKVMGKILELVSPYEKEAQEEILTTLKAMLGIED